MLRTGTGKVDSFLVSTTEVTVAQLGLYCSKMGISSPPQPLRRGIENCPAINVTPELAMAYAKWAGGRLPTSSEWEYFARANGNDNYSGSNDASDVAVYGRNKPSNVGTKKANSFCICDMTGNVAEWCTLVPGILPDDSVPVRGGAFNSPVFQLKISHADYHPLESSDSAISFRVIWPINNH